MKNRISIDYLYDIIDAIKKAEIFVEGMSFPDFEQDIKTQFAVIRSIEIIGEAAKKISDEIKTQFPRTPWKEICGIRDKLIHDYFGVDIDVIWQTLMQDLPTLKNDIEEIIESLTQ